MPLWTVRPNGTLSLVDASGTAADQLVDLADLVDPAGAELGPVLLHDPGGPFECLVRSGELIVLRPAVSEVRNRLRHLIEEESDDGVAFRILLRPSERSHCVEIAASAGAHPNHVHLSCPIMIGTSRPVVGKRLPPAVAGEVALLDTSPSGAHGGLVADVLRRHGAAARTVPVLSPSGFGTDVSLARGLAGAADDLLVVASGTYTVDDRCPPVLEAALAGRRVVAAAGNGGSSRPWWPAAAPSVVAVGALDGRFSGTGSWVDAWESGVDVPGTESLCTGTSFAAAVHAARLAAHFRPRNR